jgi:phage tail tape-measure protein
MKKLLFGLVAMLMLSFTGNAQELSSDKNFEKLVIEMESFKSYVSDCISSNSLNINDVKSNLTNIQQGLTYEQNMSEVNKIFKKDVSERLKKHVSVYNEKMEILSQKYNMKDENLLKQSYEIAYNRSAGGGQLEADPCGWRFNLCIIAAGAGAVLCHAGCDTTALAATAGLGIPACVYLCGTLQVAASVQCHDTYCK